MWLSSSLQRGLLPTTRNPKLPADAIHKQWLQTLQAVDGHWSIETRPTGVFASMQNGNVWEKAGLGLTHATGTLTTARAHAMSERGRDVKPGDRYEAHAVSLVLHAASPHVPTFRADVRSFELSDGECWYGGGADLTPSYVYDDDATDFHAYWRDVCGRHPAVVDYASLKSWCDRYFFLPSRNETRGVGGIFFDDLAGAGALEFCEDVADALLGSYLPLVERRRATAVSEAQRRWQRLRRGRYLEFNLLYDRGVKFGLEAGTSDAVERLMVSAPPVVAFEYKAAVEVGSAEEYTQSVLGAPREWV